LCRLRPRSRLRPVSSLFVGRSRTPAGGGLRPPPGQAGRAREPGGTPWVVTGRDRMSRPPVRVHELADGWSADPRVMRTRAGSGAMTVSRRPRSSSRPSTPPSGRGAALAARGDGPAPSAAPRSRGATARARWGAGLRQVDDLRVLRGSAAAPCISDGRRLLSASKAVTSTIRCVTRSIARYVRRRVSGTQLARRLCETSRERAHRDRPLTGDTTEVGEPARRRTSRWSIRHTLRDRRSHMICGPGVPTVIHCGENACPMGLPTTT
jgi:hypothetical protein